MASKGASSYYILSVHSSAVREAIACVQCVNLEGPRNSPNTWRGGLILIVTAQQYSWFEWKEETLNCSSCTKYMGKRKF